MASLTGVGGDRGLGSSWRCWRVSVVSSDRRSGWDGSGGFGRFWAASTVSDFGTYVTTVALQVLVVVTLDGSATDVGVVSAARWLPYLALGVFVGVLADRVRRRPVLVVTDLARAAVLVLIPVLVGLEVLSVGVLAAFMVVFGVLSLANDAVHQSFLPRLVPRASLGRANARLQQSDSAAQATGPALAGALVSFLGAPLAVLVDALSYLVSGLLTATIRVQEPRAQRPGRRRGARSAVVSVLGELREGVVWIYGHRTLSPLAVATHVWFLFFAVLGTVYAPFVLRGVAWTPSVSGSPWPWPGSAAWSGPPPPRASPPGPVSRGRSPGPGWPRPPASPRSP